MSYSMNYVVENVNITANTLRYYEKEGLLKNISRDSRGRRVYIDENMEVLHFIRSLRLTGMPISDIKKYLELNELGDETISQRKEMILQHKTKVQDKIQEDLKYLEIISYKAAIYELKEREFKQKDRG
ncbi:DNA-binding transcriptional MerR regulator [Croceifilum oryzae]|uniref:DNA-binding transcriptional MerR regulator n=1 Tax=Croceifilum oryzae TaxID=1553429 RepID=A0AAJ1TE60_9BACL|nr:MerR family transcriptional regulator [Croceifilum oryzae]MDQ0417183.1 DNA-binding transcriptional MerR regulator [Croceifilum oryzae]